MINKILYPKIMMTCSQNNDQSKSQQNIAEVDKELKDTSDKNSITQIK